MWYVNDFGSKHPPLFAVLKAECFCLILFGHMFAIVQFYPYSVFLKELSLLERTSTELSSDSKFNRPQELGPTPENVPSHLRQVNSVGVMVPGGEIFFIHFHVSWHSNRSRTITKGDWSERKYGHDFTWWCTCWYYYDDSYWKITSLERLFIWNMKVLKLLGHFLPCKTSKRIQKIVCHQKSYEN